MEAVGAEVHDWQVGDRVCALVAGGGYAEYCAAPAPQCLPVPRGIDVIHAAAIPETSFTVWTNVFERGRLAPGESILVHGGSSGIGTTAIQLACVLGARVFATAGSAGKCAACEALGAERAFNYRETDFVAAVKEATGGRGVDVVLDMVGGEYLQRNIESLATDGRLVLIGQLGGPTARINIVPVLQRRLTIVAHLARAPWPRRARSRRPCTSTAASRIRCRPRDPPSHALREGRKPTEMESTPTSASWCFSRTETGRAGRRGGKRRTAKSECFGRTDSIMDDHDASDDGHQAGSGPEAATGMVRCTTPGGCTTASGRSSRHQVDSSRDRNDPFAFRLGARQVIASRDQGVAGMKVAGPGRSDPWRSHMGAGSRRGHPAECDARVRRNSSRNKLFTPSPQRSQRTSESAGRVCFPPRSLGCGRSPFGCCECRLLWW